MMKRIHQLLLLFLVLLQGCRQPREELDYAYEEDAHSREEDAYYRALHGQVRAFVPASRSYIDSLLYPQLTVSYQKRVANPFKSVRETTDLQEKYWEQQEKYLQLRNQRGTAVRKDSASGRLSACLDSLRAWEYARRIGSVPAWAVLRTDSSRGRLAILYLDAGLENGEAGYWIGIREKGQWRRYYTGLVQNHFFYVKPWSRLAFVAGDSAFQVEAALVRKVSPGTQPVVELPAYELLRDGLVLTLSLKELARDTDGDGLTDVMERKLFTHPHRPDTDRDGIRDGEDNNPLNRGGNGALTILYQYLLEHATDSCFLSFTRPDFSCGRKLPRRDTAGRTYFIVSDDPALRAVAGTRNRYVIVNRAQASQYRRTNPVSPKVIFLSPLFRINHRKHSYKITLGSGPGTNTYWVVRTEEGWFVKWIGGSII